jgi:hypothetical protein
MTKSSHAMRGLSGSLSTRSSLTSEIELLSTDGKSIPQFGDVVLRECLVDKGWVMGGRVSREEEPRDGNAEREAALFK